MLAGEFLCLELLVSREKLPLNAGNACRIAKTAFPRAMVLVLALGGMKFYFPTLRLGFQLLGAELHLYLRRAGVSSGNEGIKGWNVDVSNQTAARGQ